MFSKIIKKSQPEAEAGAEAMHQAASGAAWEGRLQAALGNDMELLALAIDAPSVDHKLSAVLALEGEDV
ncbi:MAG: hypothetical protein NT159_24575, partial [Proteobacteria bacterium]|nr:hypothetical protein [Pseudomonadota bacterium]